MSTQVETFGEALARHDGEWSEDDVLALPEDGGRVELLDGALVMSPQSAYPHQRLSRRLAEALEAVAPPELEVLEAVNIRLRRGQLFIPDLAVITTPGLDALVAPAADVLLVVEITSPSSVTMDRVLKPAVYAAAGIPFYLRVDLADRGVEGAGIGAVLHRLAGQVYAEAERTAADGLLRLTQPFAVELDLDALSRATHRPPLPR